MRITRWLVTLILAVGCETASTDDTEATGSDAADGVADAADAADATADGTDGSDAADGSDGPDGSDAADVADGSDGTGQVEVTYHADLAPIINQRCQGCHVEGESAPMALDTYAAVKTFASAAVAAIEDGRMPPWLPDPDCRHFEAERLLAPGELDTLKQWISLGMPEGTPPAIPLAPPKTDTFEPTHTGRSTEAYTPSNELPDDWRCFVLDTVIDRDLYMNAIEVVPDQRAEVHHVLVYALAESQRPVLEGADADEAGPGFTCFGGPNPGAATGVNGGFNLDAGFPTQLGAWVPGAGAGVLADDTAIRIQKGSVLVMQVHYNLLSATPTPDRSTLNLRLVEEAPKFLMNTVPLAIRSLAIPAGAAEDTYTVPFTNWGEEAVVLGGVAAHMHMLGTRFEVKHQVPSAPDECLLKIDEWDFNWQQFYRFPTDDGVTIAPGESIELTCAYDNSQANQPVVNGEQLEPRDVAWGESSLDEMCLLYISTIRPFAPVAPAGAVACPTADACLSACEASGAVDCMLQCPSVNLTCSRCVLTGMKSCALQCLAPLAADPAAVTCISNCGVATLSLGGNLGRCMAATCPEAYTKVVDCLEPVVATGVCDESLTACGVTRPK